MGKMKKIVCIMMMALVAWMPTTRGQQPEEGVARHNVKMGLSSMIFCMPSVGYECRVGLRSGFGVNVAVGLPSKLDLFNVTNAMFAQVEYRFYPVKQRRCGAMPYIGVGANWVHAWREFDCYVGNEGWNIITKPYTLRQDCVRPVFFTGVRVNIPFGLTLESQMGFVAEKGHDGDLIDRGKVVFQRYMSMLFVTRIGWAF